MTATTDRLSGAAAEWQAARQDPLTLSRLTEALESVVGARVSRASAAREHHGVDEAYHTALPDVVATPTSTEEVVRIVKLCNAFRCPITCWGAGTSLEGNALAVFGGLSLDLSAMSQIIALEPDDLTATAEAGVRRDQLNRALRDTGLFFSVDPGADATLGGMAATRASGTTAVRYGTMRANVLACTAVMADGRVIETARRAPKSAAGYDLTALLLGSEGTLGIITELTVRLHPVPEETLAAVGNFNCLEDAVQVAAQCIQCGLDLARIELLDASMMSAINQFSRQSNPVRPTLFFELHGSVKQIEAQMELLKDLCESRGGRITRTARHEEERTALWKARHNALYASRALRPGGKTLITDVCVPISRLAQCVEETRADLDASGVVATIAGHVGDGNFHTFIVIDPNVAREIEVAESLHERMARRAISMRGSCTGEHGIGVGKRHLLREELGDAVSVMVSIKAALDPGLLLNPGKISH